MGEEDRICVLNLEMRAMTEKPERNGESGKGEGRSLKDDKRSTTTLLTLAYTLQFQKQDRTPESS